MKSSHETLKQDPESACHSGSTLLDKVQWLKTAIAAKQPIIPTVFDGLRRAIFSGLDMPERTPFDEQPASSDSDAIGASEAPSDALELEDTEPTRTIILEPGSAVLAQTVTVELKTVIHLGEAESVTQEVKIEGEQPTELQVETKTVIRRASVGARPRSTLDFDGIRRKADDRSIIRKQLPGLDKRELESIVASADSYEDARLYDALYEEMPLPTQMHRYRTLCKICDKHGITYGKQVPYCAREYTLAIMSLTRLLRRHKVVVPYKLTSSDWYCPETPVI